MRTSLLTVALFLSSALTVGCYYDYSPFLRDAGWDAGIDGGSDGGLDAGHCDVLIPPVVDCQDYGGTLGWMCTVPAGCFMMGCNPDTDMECQEPSEFPYHPVTFANAFRIDKYEATVSQYKACNTASPSTCTTPTTGYACNWGIIGRDDHPINCVNWIQARAYCKWAGKRLPSEAEWEKAARGTDGRKYPWGNTGLDCDHAVQNVTSCGYIGTAVVGSKPPGVSPYGLMDMIGNVWEQVEDDWHDDYIGAPVDGSAWICTPARCPYIVLRGGAWATSGSDSWRLRAAYRLFAYPSGIGSDTRGFRCAVTP